MRRTFGAVLTATLLSVTLLSAACGTSAHNAAEASDTRLRVVASFYPLAEVARRVGGDVVRVQDLTPVGVEPHDVELTTDDVDAMQDAAVVLHMGSGFQPAIERVANRRHFNGNVEVGLLVGGDGRDPHVWLDPTRMIRIVELVRDSLANADAKHGDEFTRNAAAYIAELRDLDVSLRTGLSNCVRRDLVTAHAAFGYLAARYGLKQRAISGVSPDAEPSPSRLADLADFVRTHGVTTVFYEELVPRGFAETLAKDAGVRTAVLNPIEGLTKREQRRGDDYVSIMDRNRNALIAGLGCT